MAASTFSRRISEFVGVALFALALIWLIALVTYEPTDPVWFFTTGACRTRRRTSSAASARSSPSCRFSCSATAPTCCPASIAVVGWHYFWCQTPDAAYTKAFGVALLFVCASALPQPRVRQHRAGGQDVPRRRLARRLARAGARRLSEPHRLDHRAADADDAVGHPVDAVLVRPDVRQRQRRLARPVGARPRRACAAGSTSAGANAPGAR